MPAARVALARLLPVAFVTLVIAAPLVYRLATIPPQYPHRQWLIEEPSPIKHVPRNVPLNFAGFLEGTDTYRLPLTTRSLEELLQYDELAVVIGALNPRAELVEASMLVDGTRCRYTTRPLTPLVSNHPLWMYQNHECQPLKQSPSGGLTLEFRLVYATGPVALWTFEDLSQRTYMLYAPQRDQWHLVVRGLAGRTFPASSLTRADLLATMWDEPAFWIWIRCAIAVLVCLIGVALLHQADQRWTGVSSAIAASLGAGALMTSLGLFHAVAIPPLQGFDEPSHLMTFGSLFARPEVVRDVPPLAERLHFERIRHRSDQHFRAADIGVAWRQPFTAGVYFEPLAERSPLAYEWWRALSRALPAYSTLDLLWRLRVANTLLVGTSAALTVLLLALALPDRRRALLPFVFFAIPTVPFFGMVMSDTTVSVAVGMLLAAAVAAVVLDSDKDQIVGASLGIAVCLVIFSGRRSWPLLLVLAPVLLVRAISGSRAGLSGRSLLLFWGGFVVTTMAGLAWANTLGLFDRAAVLIARRRPDMAGLAQAFAARPWILPVLLTPLPLVEAAVSRFRRNSAPPARSTAAVWIGAVAAALIVGATVISRYVALPTTLGYSVATSSASEYVMAVLRSMTVPLRTGHFDVLLSTMFWGGFGWVDTIPPEWVLAILCLASAVLLAWAFVESGARGGMRGLSLMTSLVAGIALALAGTALGTYALQYDLHGRYLIGWYLVLLMPGWLVLSRVPRPAFWVCITPLFLVQGYCLQLIAIRYF